MDGNEVYELREARSEISRHHTLIADLRDALEWALDELIIYKFSGLYDPQHHYDAARKLINRQVS